MCNVVKFIVGTDIASAEQSIKGTGAAGVMRTDADIPGGLGDRTAAMTVVLGS